MKILLFDNYDSFTYNLLHVVKALGYDDVDVRRNDQIDLLEVARYDKIILSPGGGIPSEAGILLPLIREYAPTKSILGICLGEQAIAEAFGATLINMQDVQHGVSCTINITDRDYIFDGIGPQIEVGRYHSWIVSGQDLPSDLVVTAKDDSGNIMALSHRLYDIRGVQFHPESVLTPCGEKIIENWLRHDPLAIQSSF